MRLLVAVLVAVAVVVGVTLLVTGCPKKEAPPSGEIKSTETEPEPIIAPKEGEKAEEGAVTPEEPTAKEVTPAGEQEKAEEGAEAEKAEEGAKEEAKESETTE